MQAKTQAVLFSYLMKCISGRTELNEHNWKNETYVMNVRNVESILPLRCGTAMHRLRFGH